MFGFLGAIGQDIESAAKKAGSGVQSLVNQAKNDPSLGGVVQSTVDKVRQDLANGVAAIGAGATTGASQAIAGNGKGPFVLPFTKTTIALGGALLVLVVVLIVVLARRRRG